MYMLFSLIPLIILGLIAYYGFTGLQKFSSHYDQKVNLPSKLMGVLLLVAIAYNVFVFEAKVGVGWSLFFTFFFASVFYLFPQTKRSFFSDFFIYIGIIASLALGGRANDFMLDFNLFVIFISIISLVILYVVQEAEKHLFAFIQSVFVFIFGVLRQLKLLFEFARNHKDKNRFHLLQILKTSAITIIVSIFFIFLLSKADPVFADLMERVFGNLEKRIFLTFLIVSLITWILTISIKSKKTLKTDLAFLNYYDFFVPLVFLTTLLAVFLVIQFKYLFGGHADLLSFDLTYSEYVRKGFLELLFATFFGTLVSVLILLKKEYLSEKESKNLQLINFLLLAELFLMLFSAFKRDVIYIDSYGLTRIRIFGAMFLLWLSALFVLILTSNFTQKFSQRKILTTAGSLGFGVFLFLNLVNLDQFIVNYNAKHFPEKKDIFYNTLLSSDAVLGWQDAVLTAQKNYNQLPVKPILDQEEKKLLAESKLAVKSLIKKRDELYNYYGSVEEMKENDYADLPRGFPDRLKYKRKWQAWNWSEKHAFDYLKKEEKVFTQTLNCLEKNIDFYQIKNSIHLNTEMRNRLDEYEYPLTQKFHYHEDLWDMQYDLFRLFVNYLNQETNSYKYEINYSQAMEPIFQKIELELRDELIEFNLGKNKIDAYDERDGLFKDFKKALRDNLKVEKCS